MLRTFRPVLLAPEVRNLLADPHNQNAGDGSFADKVAAGGYVDAYKVVKRASELYPPDESRSVFSRFAWNNISTVKLVDSFTFQDLNETNNMISGEFTVFFGR